MLQRFYENTQISNLVKNIVSTESIPVLNYVKEGSPIIAGCKYIYNDRLIEAVNSDLLSEENNNFNYIPCDEEDITKIRYVSPLNWYDSDTHKYFGKYLRYIRETTNIDLMPYYNCYSSLELNDIYLNTLNTTQLVCSDDDIEDELGIKYPKVTPNDSLKCGVKTKSESEKSYRFGTNTRYKVLAIPIRFDTNYTIAVDSDDVVSIRCLIYNPVEGMIKESSSVDTEIYFSDYLGYSSKTLPFTRFSHPFLYSIPLYSTDMSDDIKKQLYTREDDLYLVLQLPKESNSSIVVIEGDYTNKRTQVIQSNYYNNETQWNLRYPIEDMSNAAETKIYSSNLSLLYYNTGVSYAFSDRLVEYLLLNVISNQETLYKNIERVQLSLSNLYGSYKNRLENNGASLSVWNDTIKDYILSFVNTNMNNMEFPFDQDGYINKDVEYILSKKGVYTT